MRTAFITVLGITLCFLTQGQTANRASQKSGGSKVEGRSTMLAITCDYGSVHQCGSREDLDKLLSIFISAKPDRVCLEIAYPDITNYPTKIGLFPKGRPRDRLYEQGIDPMKVMVETLKAKGIQVLANVRMNDAHSGDENWTPWERKNKIHALTNDTGERDRQGSGALRQMDYAVEEVRRHRLSIIKEALQKYPFDGLQLDFGRQPRVLSRPRHAKAYHLTDYVRSVRKLTDTVGCIVPWDLDYCADEGLDVGTWIREELVSYVSPGEWFYADWNIDWKAWRELTDGTQCALIPVTPGNVSPFDRGWERGALSRLPESIFLNEELIRGMAANFLHQGVDGFMFFNFYAPSFKDLYPGLRDYITPGNKGTYRFYRAKRNVYTADGRRAFFLGWPFRRDELDEVGAKALYRLYHGLAVGAGKAELRVVVEDTMLDDKLTVKLNGKTLSGTEARSDEGHSVLTFNAPEPLREGKNRLEIEWTTADPMRQGEPGDPLFVGEIDLRVRVE